MVGERSLSPNPGTWSSGQVIPERRAAG